MKIAGIIAEYNPFHNGHKYHLDQVKRLTGADAVVAVISGSVTQRGEIALCDKWSRAQMAVDNGIDLVLELPFAFAVNSAEEFARGGVSVLQSLGCVTDLVFGCESDPETVISMARRSAEKEEEFQRLIRSGLEQGLSYPQARGNAMVQFLGDSIDETALQGAAMDQPNDILAVEYVRQLVLQGSSITPHGIKRLGKYHDTQLRREDGEDSSIYSSATAVRKAVRAGRMKEAARAVPEPTLDVLRNSGFDFECTERTMGNMEAIRMDSMLLSHLLYLGPERLREIQGCSAGLEYRIWKALPNADSLEELLKLVSSGRYPTARIRRVLMHSLVGLTKEKFNRLKKSAMDGGLCTRVLGFNETGAKLLKQIKKSELPPILYTNLNKELNEEEKSIVRGEKRIADLNGTDVNVISLALDLRAAEIAAMSRGERLYGNSDFVKNPYIAHKSEKNHK